MVKVVALLIFIVIENHSQKLSQLNWGHSIPNTKDRGLQSVRKGVWDRNSGAKPHGCADFKQWGLQNAICVKRIVAARKKQSCTLLCQRCLSVCVRLTYFTQGRRRNLYTQRPGGREDGGSGSDRESETACACEGQKSIARIFFSGSLAWE